VNVLYPVSLTDTILRLDQTRAFSVHWTEKVFNEAENALIRDGKNDPVRIAKRFADIRMCFPESMITGHDALLDSMTCDPEDRHVLAAAIGNVDQLVTDNIQNFPEESTAGYGIEIVSPDELLLNAIYLYPKLVVRVIRLNALAKHVPNFAQTVEKILRA
jgi:hypothetical protein